MSFVLVEKKLRKGLSLKENEVSINKAPIVFGMGLLLAVIIHLVQSRSNSNKLQEVKQNGNTN
jgi:hypothetical protein